MSSLSDNEKVNTDLKKYETPETEVIRYSSSDVTLDDSGEDEGT